MPAMTKAAQKFKAETGIPVYKWDVSSYDSCVEGLKKVEAELGPVEVLVNNAGITKDHHVSPYDAPNSGNAVIDTNLNSLFNMCRPVIEGMRNRKFGRIINISSINGQKGQFRPDQLFGRQGGRAWVHQGARAGEPRRAGVTVNAICPGYIATEMVKARAQGRPGEEHPAAHSARPSRRAGGDRGAAFVFLASDDAGLITGSTLSANGGQVMM